MWHRRHHRRWLVVVCVVGTAAWQPLQRAKSSLMGKKNAGGAMRTRVVESSQEREVTDPNLKLGADEVSVEDTCILGRGSYGEVVAAEEVATGAKLVAKRCREDALSKKYFGIEKKVNELVWARDPVDSLYRGSVERPATTQRKKGLFGQPKREELLVFDRVPGRDCQWYVQSGACGVEALAAALMIPHASAAEECCLVDDDDACWSDPSVAVASPTQVEVALRVCAEAAEALGRLHAVGVCHRDVKPANLVVDAEAHRIRLVDLGSAWCSETRLGYDPKRSPVSPRYCPPEQFVSPDDPSWRSFDTYAVAVAALRVLLSPALASDNDLDAFNLEFRQASYKLDAWLGAKLAQTAVDSRLEAALSAVHKKSKLAAKTWRLLAAMLLEDPADRLDAEAAARQARELLSQAQASRADSAADSDSDSDDSADDPFVPRRFQPLHSHQWEEEQEAVPLRVPLVAPAGVDLEEDDDGHVLVTSVKPDSPAAKLGAPLPGDRLIWIESVNGLTLTDGVDAANAAARAIPKGGIFELKVISSGAALKKLPPIEKKPNPKILKKTPTKVRAGAYRRRGEARAACEDAVAIWSEGGVVDRLDAPDFPSRAESSEAMGPFQTKTFAAALVADGHGGQAASRHVARRLPELLASKPAQLEDGLRAAWARCVEEYLDVRDGVGAVCAAVALDIDSGRAAALHCGDSRLVAVKDGRVALDTRDHVLDDPAERAALVNRGGVLDDTGRVRAGRWLVAVPRALGGHAWRDAGIAPVADVLAFDSNGIDALVLGSDGLFDVFSSSDVALYVKARQIFRPNEDASDIARALAERAAHAGSTDDVSVAVLLLS